jgi:peptidoglycan/LPS O-acetylase OafA/YrhL
MAAAFALRNHKIRHTGLIFISGIVLFCLAAALEDMNLLDGYGNIARLAYGIPAAMVVLGLAAADRRDILHMPSVLRMVGGASYSIYLFQFIFIGTAWQALLILRLDQRLPVAMDFLVLSLAGIIGGIMTSYWIEHPLIRWLRNQSRAPRARTSLPAVSLARDADRPPPGRAGLPST